MAESSQSQKATHVQVAVRCRPPNTEERKSNNPTVVACDTENRQVKVNYGPMAKKITKTFSFDRVFGMYSTQEEVFESMVLPIVDETLAGFNCTIFAYGQTGTGKTHTMEGDIHSQDNAGIVPRSVTSILDKLESTGADFTIRVSFLELYNEELQDLLAVDSSSSSNEDKGRLRLCEDAKKGVVCQNLEEITVLNASDIFDILKRGIKQRQTAATLCNKNSSRSHSIFTMKIMIRETNVEGEEVVRHGQLNLVDLAGSECVGRSGAKNARAREAGSINQSLLTLGRVITALVDHHGHIPYRDSKLTRLLQESLGGKAKTCIIATLSPSALAVEESLSTLDYAHRAKSIKNQPQINQRMTKKVVMKEYCAEIESLRLQLQITREKNGIYVDPATFENMESRLASQEMQITECETALRTKNEEVKTLREEVDEVGILLDETRESLRNTGARLEATENDLMKTKEEAAYLQVEWDAAEAVVGEQSFTEESLAEHVSNLQRDVTKRQEDVVGLFSKVDRHAAKERSRINNIEDFVSRIDRTQSELAISVQDMVSKSNTQSTHLCDGVSDMLTRGKSMCDELKASIGGALSVLIGDTTVAKDNMSASCDSLQNHLTSTQVDVIRSLQSLQESLSDWLGGVEDSMLQTQGLIQEQQTQMHTILGAIKETSTGYSAANEKFLQCQKEHSESVISCITSMKGELCDKVREIEQAHASQLQKQDDMIQQNAENIRKNINGLLSEMLTSQQSFHKESTTMSRSMLSNLEEYGSSQLNSISKQISDHSSSATTSQREMADIVGNGVSTFTRMVQEADGIGGKALSRVDDIAATAGAKRNVLDSTVSGLSEDVTSAISKACGEVQKTSTTATTMLEDVKKASEKMDGTTSLSMDDFTQYLDGQGESLNQELGLHFEHLHAFLGHQGEGIDTTRKEGQEFALSSSSDTLKPTGTTPEKVPFKPLEDITRTRNHDIIKNETRTSKMPRSESCDSSDSLSSPLKASTSECDSSDVQSNRSSKSLDGESTGSDDASYDVENSDPQRTNESTPTECDADDTTKSTSAAPKLLRSRSGRIARIKATAK